MEQVVNAFRGKKVSPEVNTLIVPASREILDQMEEGFGKDYNICKRRAFCEVDLQNEKENSLRDYTMFAQYYDEALRLYEDQLEGNDTDAEMGLLKQVYQQVKTGGWL